MAALKYSITFGNSVVCASAASVAIPAGTELLNLSASGSMHFRIGVGAQTAVVTDPLITPGSPPLCVKLNADQTYTLAAIYDAVSTTGALSAYVVQEA